MNYVNKAEMSELLVEYQSLTDDLNDKWLTKYKSAPRRKLTPEKLEEFYRVRDEFKAFKTEQFKLRKQMLETETPAEKILREKKLKIVKEKIGTMFSLITDGVLTLPEFNNEKARSFVGLAGDMKCDALWTAYNYIDRYDTRRKNPFAYFTEMIKNACRQKKDETYNNQIRYPSLDHIENMEGEELIDASFLTPMGIDEGI